MSIDVYAVTPKNYKDLSTLINKPVSLWSIPHHILVYKKDVNLESIEIFSNESACEIWSVNNNFSPLIDSAVKWCKKSNYWIISSSPLSLNQITPLDHSPITQLKTPDNMFQYIIHFPGKSLEEKSFYNVLFTFNINKIKYGVLNTLDDGSCFFHSILYAIHPNYRELSHQKQHESVCEFRSSIAEKTTLDLFKTLGNGELANFGAEVYMSEKNILFDGAPNGVPDAVYSAVHNHYVQKIANTRKWVGDDMIDLVHKLFNIGVLIFTCGGPNGTSPTIYQHAVPDNYYDSCSVFVVVWYERSHYNVVVALGDNNEVVKYNFNHDDCIVRYFKK
jgi:hypothetical protein